MEILSVKFTCGPNYWSVKKHRLVVMLLDIKEFETQPTNEIHNFYHRIKEAFPGIYSHQCSEGVPGGFFNRVREGTWIGHVIEHIALELQILAGKNVGFGRTRGNGTKGQYHIVFECLDEESGQLTAEKAVSIAQSLIDGASINIDQHVKEIRKLIYKNDPGPSTSALLHEAEKRGIPFIELGDRSTYQLGYGCYQKKIAATITSSTSNMAVEISCDKEACRKIFNEMSIPIAEGAVVNSLDELKAFITTRKFPLVAKPVNGNQGRGVTTNITSIEEAVKAYNKASEISEGVLIEQHVPGNDYRLLTVNGKLVAAAKRTPANVTGDGEKTIQHLIEIVNLDANRGNGHGNALTKITVTDTINDILSQKGYSLDTVLNRGEVLFLDHAANLSKGGTAEDVTDQVHPDISVMAERISRMIDLDICGIDVMAPTLEQPLSDTGGVVIEVNAAPGFRMHLFPSKGKSQNVAASVLDMLFPHENKSRIPIVAVTGTNGKTTTTRLISHILKGVGRRVGSTTTDGVYVNDTLLMKGDCGGPLSAKMILKDPTVDTAVLECARGGILRAGLGFDRCDVAVVTNVDSDHLGMNGINTLDQMAKLKSVVPESVHSSGYAVLNADDNRVYAMREKLQCNIVLFSMNADNQEVKKHRESGGICVVFKNQYIIIWDGKTTHTIGKAVDMPLSFEGRAEFMIENILAAVAASYTQKVSPVDIRKSLYSFKPSPELLPGRMNVFKFDNYDVLIDYAHNAAGMKALKNFIKSPSYRYKVGIVSGIGDRRKEDNIEIGRLAAELFDEIIIREDCDLRGKEPGEASEIVKQGIVSSPHNPSFITIPNAGQAVQLALEKAQPGALITICVEKIDEAISIIKQHQEKLTNRNLPVLKMHYNNNIAI